MLLIDLIISIKDIIILNIDNIITETNLVIEIKIGISIIIITSKIKIGRTFLLIFCIILIA